MGGYVTFNDNIQRLRLVIFSPVYHNPLLLTMTFETMPCYSQNHALVKSK